MLFVTDDHRTVCMPEKAKKPQGVVPSGIDPVLLAAITQTPIQKTEVKPTIKELKSHKI